MTPSVSCGEVIMSGDKRLKGNVYVGCSDNSSGGDCLARENMIASAFSDTVSYEVGDYVTYNNILYRCTTAHTAGVWVAGHFTQVTVDSELSAISYLSRDNLMYHQESGVAVLYNAAYYWQLPSNNTYLVHLTASDKNSPGDNYDGIIKFTYGGTSTTITNITHYRLSGTGSIDAENNLGTLQFSFTSGITEVCLALLG